MQNFPNPFNPLTEIQYTIRWSGHVLLQVYNILGIEVACLVNNEQHQGSYKVKFDASRLSSGIYYYSLRSGNFSETKKMALIR